MTQDQDKSFFRNSIIAIISNSHQQTHPVAKNSFIMFNKIVDIMVNMNKYRPLKMNDHYVEKEEASAIHNTT